MSDPLDAGHSGQRASKGPVLRLAVLPFANVTAAPIIDAYSLGVTEAVARALRTSGLHACSDTVAATLNRDDLHVRQLGGCLKVDGVLLGNVRDEEGLVCLTVQLLRTTDGSCVWLGRFDCKSFACSDLLERVALDIAREVRERWDYEPR